MKECRNHRVGTKFQLLGNNTCHGNRMYDIRLTSLAALLTVSLGSKGISIAYTLHIFNRHTFLHAGKQRFHTLIYLGCKGLVHGCHFFRVILQSSYIIYGVALAANLSWH